MVSSLPSCITLYHNPVRRMMGILRRYETSGENLQTENLCLLRQSFLFVVVDLGDSGEYSTSTLSYLLFLTIFLEVSTIFLSNYEKRK